MTTIDLQDHDTVPGVDWIVSLESDVPQRLAKIEFDVNTLLAFVDVADAATHSLGNQTRENAGIFRDYFLRIIRELETRSLIDHRQWNATEHLAAAE